MWHSVTQCVSLYNDSFCICCGKPLDGQTQQKILLAIPSGKNERQVIDADIGGSLKYKSSCTLGQMHCNLDVQSRVDACGDTQGLVWSWCAQGHFFDDTLAQAIVRKRPSLVWFGLVIWARPFFYGTMTEQCKKETRPSRLSPLRMVLFGHLAKATFLIGSDSTLSFYQLAATGGNRCLVNSHIFFRISQPAISIQCHPLTQCHLSNIVRFPNPLALARASESENLTITNTALHRTEIWFHGLSVSYRSLIYCDSHTTSPPPRPTGYWWV